MIVVEESFGFPKTGYHAGIRLLSKRHAVATLIFSAQDVWDVIHRFRGFEHLRDVPMLHREAFT